MTVLVSCKLHPNGHRVTPLVSRGGLAVTPMLTGRCRWSRKWFDVTHVRSGFAISDFARPEKRARALMSFMLRHAGVDWRRSAAQLARRKRRIEGVFDRFYREGRR